MSKIDLQTRTILAGSHHNTIVVHPTIMFATLPDARRLVALTEGSLSIFIIATRLYRTVTINPGNREFTIADPIPDNLQAAPRSYPSRAQIESTRVWEAEPNPIRYYGKAPPK